ncbi:hypothetical protein EJ04DRAFT_435445, partial [Polyplosphaeria fusca]
CMPRFLRPSQHTPHRVAVIALYRGLLSRCSSAQLPDEQRSGLRNAIQHKFRQNRKIQSAYQLGLTFRAGYQVLDHLDASSEGDADSTSFLTSMISTLPRGITRSPPIRRPPKPPHPSKQELAVLPPEKQVLNIRPQKVISGPRHVPRLAHAQGVPFLRIKKPQPANLSRVIRQKIDRNIMMFDRKILLSKYWEPLAQQEDQWDEQLRKACGIKPEKGNDPLWMHSVRLAKQESTQAYERYTAQDRRIAKQMHDIVEEEKKLAMAEGREVIRGRRAQHRPKKLFS